jgi:hypothetical protein
MPPSLSLGLGLALHTGPRSGVFTSLDPDAAAYIAAVQAAGGTVTATQSGAINTFVVAGKAQNWWAQVKRLYLPIWEVAAPNARCIVSGASGTYTGAVTHASGYVNSDGITGYFSFDAAPSALGCTLSSGSVFVLTTATSAIAGGTTFGRTQDGNNSRTGFFGSTGNIRALQVFSSVAPSYTETDARGVFLASRTSTLTVSAYKHNAAGFSTTVNEASASAGSVGTLYPMTFMAVNTTGVIQFFTSSTVRFGAYGMGLGMTPTQAQDFTAALKSLWETCTGLTLP